MIFTIEPMINTGHWKTKLMKDRWTARTIDGGLSAQFEHTILVTAIGLRDPDRSRAARRKRVRSRRPARNAVRSGSALMPSPRPKAKVPKRALPPPRAPKAVEKPVAKPVEAPAAPVKFDPDAAAQPGSGIFGLPTDPERARVHLIPVPFEATTSYGGGTARGPAAILEASRQVDLFDLDCGRTVRGRHRDAARGAAASAS